MVRTQLSLLIINYFSFFSRFIFFVFFLKTQMETQTPEDVDQIDAIIGDDKCFVSVF